MNKLMAFMKNQMLVFLMLFSSFGIATAQLTWQNKNAGMSRAVVGGSENGQDLLVCRCNYKGVNHPGKVVANKCHIGWGGKEVYLPNYELLVKSGNVNVQWKKSSNNRIPANAVKAGTEGNTTYYVGRARRSDGTIHPGKVFYSDGKMICNYSWGGKEIVVKSNFEVLTSTQKENTPLKVSVLNYNAMLLDKLPFPNHQQDLRANLIPTAIREAGSWDVVVINEAFSNEARAKLTMNMLLAGYPFFSAVVNGSGGMTNGGVIVYSKYQLITSDMVVFKSCSGSDCHSNKGAMYIKIRKDGRTVHIFGTHLQADRGNEERNARKGQLIRLEQFIASKTQGAESRGEPVIISGDLNICYVADRAEFNTALSILDAKMTATRPANTPWTFDPNRNSIALYRYPDLKPEWLDYVLMSNRGIQPLNSTYKVLKLKSKKIYNMAAHGDPLGWFDKGTDHYDLSDHYALSAVFTFE